MPETKIVLKNVGLYDPTSIDEYLKLDGFKALQKARDLADKTARAQRSFLTNINHEVRTPLNGVMGMLQ